MSSKSMRLALAIVTASSASPALADSTFPLTGLLESLAGNPPDGWSRNMDGSYKQAESGVLCPDPGSDSRQNSGDLPRIRAQILGAGGGGTWVPFPSLRCASLGRG
ncbi:MAG TPA: hypothetical protein VIM02_16780 [Rhizomicrobium sp.]